jgi:hypothetical protein
MKSQPHGISLVLHNNLQAFHRNTQVPCDRLVQRDPLPGAPTVGVEISPETN